MNEERTVYARYTLSTPFYYRRLFDFEISVKFTPEVCFLALAGKKPMRYGKKTDEGHADRLNVLQRHEPAVESLLKDICSTTPRKDVQRDDVLDAVVALITAESRTGVLTSLIGIPSHDRAGLPIEMLHLKT